MRYKNVSQAVLVASSLVQLALVETEWKPFYIPHLGQPITFEMAAALRGMDAEARDSHIERLLTEAATGGATAPGLERLRQILERVFLYPGFYARLPDEMDATSDLWQLRTSHVP